MVVFGAIVRASEPGEHDGPPRLDMLRDAAITVVDGTYYLTGTAGTFDKDGKVDFEYNRGAPLWTSTDLKSWNAIGYVFDRPALLKKGKPTIGFWLDWQSPSERIDALQSQATTTPRVYRINEDWFLLCSMNDQAILLQKSSTGTPEGPYGDHAVLTTRGGYPSLFTDSDGSHYLVFADGWIAKLKPDLTALAEDIRPLLPADKDRLKLGGRGVCLFKEGPTYYCFAPRWQARGGEAVLDAVLWSANGIYGPYREMGTVLKGAGSVTVFMAIDGTWKAISGLPRDGNPRILDFQLQEVTR